MTQLTGLKFVATLALVFQKIESEDKTKYENFYSSSKAEIRINESDMMMMMMMMMMMCLNQPILQL